MNFHRCWVNFNDCNFNGPPGHEPKSGVVAKVVAAVTVIAGVVSAIFAITGPIAVGASPDPKKPVQKVVTGEVRLKATMGPCGNLREGPSKRTRTIQCFNSGTPLIVLGPRKPDTFGEEDGYWYLVKINGRTGWLHEDIFTRRSGSSMESALNLVARE